jgi:hypothetical protein
MFPTQQIQITKSDITDCFNELTAYGYDVKTFNSNKPLPQSAKGMTDHLITGKGLIIFMEVKIGKDNLSSDQLEFGKVLTNAMTRNCFSTIFYFIADDKNFTEIRDLIIKGIRENLTEYAVKHYTNILKKELRIA